MLFLMTACTARPQTGSLRAESPVGCYEVRRGPWSVGTPGLVPPEAFRLDSTRIDVRGFEARAAAPGVPSLLGASQAFWYPTGAAAVVVVWRDGYQASGYSLTVRGDSVTGVAFAESDRRHAGGEPSASVLGRRVHCPP
jgi:hypothetical protein